MSDEWKFPGSRWWKFDFHTHTPASNDYGREDVSLKGLKPEEWLKKAMEADLDCVLVTDHNSGGWIDKLKDKNEELQKSNSRPDWYRELTIFPGTEITIADSNKRIHLLAVFDPNCDSDKVTAVLGACGITEEHGDEQRTSTTKSFVNTVEVIKKEDGIAIPAHIDRSNGLLHSVTSCNNEIKKSLEAISVAEFCDIHKFDDAAPELKKMTDRLAKIAGSDAHNPDEIGKCYSWIKMSKPCIEGLLLALSDYEFCVKNQNENPNRLPDIFLSQLTIKKMLHCGRIDNQPFIAELNPHFNSLIGGRGTGKSTILESIRIVARQNERLELEAPRVKEELDKFMKHENNNGVMLGDTEILLEIQRHGKHYRLRWSYDGKGAVLEGKTDKGWQKVETGDLKGRFPISIFSQKQINELASNPRGLLEIVDRSTEVNRTEWNSRWESTQSRFLQLRERKRELSRQLQNEEIIRTDLSDVGNDLKQYEDKGHGEILKQYQVRSQQESSLADDDFFDNLSSKIKKLVSETEFPDFPKHLFNEDDKTTTGVKEIHKQTTQKLEEIGGALVELDSKVKEIKKQREEAISSSEWHESVKEITKKYEGLIKEYKERENRLDVSVYDEWIRKRSQLQKKLKELDSIRKEAEYVKKEIARYLGEFQELREELFNKRKEFLNKVIGQNNFVRMDLKQYGDMSEVEDKYRDLLGLEHGKFASSVLDQEEQRGILWEFYNWENNKESKSPLTDLILEIKSQTRRIAKGENSGNHGAFNNRLLGLFEKQPAVFDQLDAWWPEDMLQIKYSRKPASGKFDALEKGSAGQKAAAILAFLLSYGEEPLIVDQPEDDLDNALIYDLIVKQIHENKNRRQLIIVTHNPNIVVNGDSELMHVLKFVGGQVKVEHCGGLEEKSIREAICTIMEGGRQAFDKRYKRITLEI